MADKKHYETEIAVIGAGGAGMAAGIEARDAGAQPVVVTSLARRGMRAPTFLPSRSAMNRGARRSSPAVAAVSSVRRCRRNRALTTIRISPSTTG